MTYPNGRALTYQYGTAGGIDDLISRPDGMSDGVTANIATYSYLGLNRLVDRVESSPQIHLTYIGGVGDGGDQYGGYDRFGRIVEPNWQRTSGPMVLPGHFRYAYDRSSEVLYKSNVDAGIKSELYHANGAVTNSAYDPLERMTSFSRGTLSASGTNGTTLDTITTPVDPNVVDPIYGSQSWTLDQLNNWGTIVSDGTSVARTHNSQNEVTAASSTVYTYDNDGNQTAAGATAYVWDAWNRAAAIGSTSYTYDAFGRRTKETTGANSRSFYYSGWRTIETRSNVLTRAYEQFIYSFEYIDAIVLRDRDADGNAATGGNGIAGSGLEERLYYCQDRNYNVVSTVVAGSGVVERMLYDPYGDISYFNASWTARSGSSYANNVGFTGRWHDSTGMIYFRARYYEPVLGRFISRDPARREEGSITAGDGYQDGMSLYCGYFVPNGFDPFGLADSDTPPPPPPPSGGEKKTTGADIPGGLKREWPGGVPTDLDADALEKLARQAEGQKKRDLQKAKKLIEQADRLQGKKAGRGGGGRGGGRYLAILAALGAASQGSAASNCDTEAIKHEMENYKHAVESGDMDTAEDSAASIVAHLKDAGLDAGFEGGLTKLHENLVNAAHDAQTDNGGNSGNGANPSP